MRASECVADRFSAEALRPEPSLVIAHHLPAVAAVFEVGRHRRLGHRPGIAAIRTFRIRRPIALTFRNRNNPKAFLPIEARHPLCRDASLGPHLLLVASKGKRWRAMLFYAVVGWLLAVFAYGTRIAALAFAEVFSADMR